MPLPSQSPSLPDSSALKELVAQALNANSQSSTATRDEFSAFGDFVVSELRSIPPNRAAYVKRKLNRTLMDLMDEVASIDNT